jgi:hypothetical protein
LEKASLNYELMDTLLSGPKLTDNCITEEEEEEEEDEEEKEAGGGN